ncbi:hypothetical protein KIN20_000869 [Parelaphostrongylus tenuis]|uniref:Uncharacterized protein n=1 Tax=Parelaphostrongylus tenuis TaxID=148309 RepID=A0AAD5LWZ3_PARTN|nr:hypothetical protein KIN20_000869 [Parelaphostrongylus tenuis]
MAPQLFTGIKIRERGSGQHLAVACAGVQADDNDRSARSGFEQRCYTIRTIQSGLEDFIWSLVPITQHRQYQCSAHLRVLDHPDYTAVDQYNERSAPRYAAEIKRLEGQVQLLNEIVIQHSVR